jgi:hypothetical protein
VKAGGILVGLIVVVLVVAGFATLKVEVTCTTKTTRSTSSPYSYYKTPTWRSPPALEGSAGAGDTAELRL